MPSKFKRAIAAMKDQTSISLAKVGGTDSSNLEVAILKATTHDEVPIDERHVSHILQIVSSNRSHAGSCARAIGRRIGRTKTWIVAAKSLMLVLRIFQDGDPHFPKEVLHAMKRGYRILNLHSFRDDSSTHCPWDFTAFVRTFALYLDARLECFVTGKLQRRTSTGGTMKGYSRKNEPIVRDMKPSVLLDRIVHWQKLLDRAIATQPTGAARTNPLILTCVYAIVEETFDLYRDISSGLALLLDSFFHLQYKNCVSAFQTCVKASKQFEELSAFYDLCKRIGVGRISEYPSVQKVSQELLETLQEFLKDKSSFPTRTTDGRSTSGSSSTRRLPPLSPNCESGSVRRSGYGGSQSMSLEDLIGGYSPDRYSDPGREDPQQFGDRYSSANDTCSVQSEPVDHHGINSVMDLLSLDPPLDESHKEVDDQNSSSSLGWEMVLFETTPDNQSSEGKTTTQYGSTEEKSGISSNSNGFVVDFFDDFNAPSASASSSMPDEHSYNPFLQDTFDFISPTTASNTFDLSQGNYAPSTNANFSNGFPPTFQAEFSNTTGEMMNNHPSQGGSFPSSSHARYSNSNSNNNQHYQDYLFGDLLQGTNFNSSTYVGSFSQHNRSMSTSFLDNFDVPGAPLTHGHTKPNHHARFASTDLSASPSFLRAINDNSNGSVSERPITHHVRYGSNVSATSSYADAYDSFGGYNNSGLVPARLSTDTSDFSANTNAMNAIVPCGGYNNGLVSTRLSTDTKDLNANTNTVNEVVQFGGYNNGLVPKRLSIDTRDINVNTNSMNAIVPFGEERNDDFLSSGHKFESAPTFRATSVDMDHQEQNGLWDKNDPFGSCYPVINSSDQKKMNGSLDQQNILQQQQQLWLQYQNKIMASRHLT